MYRLFDQKLIVLKNTSASSHQQEKQISGKQYEKLRS